MTVYNRIAAQDLGRIAALSDGIFAFAMTVRWFWRFTSPERRRNPFGSRAFGPASALGPRLVARLLSLMTLGIFWVGQQTHLNHLTHADRDLKLAGCTSRSWPA